MSSIHVAEYLCSAIAPYLNSSITKQLNYRAASLRRFAKAEGASGSRAHPTFPLALRGKADFSIPAVYFPPVVSCRIRKQYTEAYTEPLKGGYE
jgi:hypothetical protein